MRPVTTKPSPNPGPLMALAGYDNTVLPEALPDEAALPPVAAPALFVPNAATGPAAAPALIRGSTADNLRSTLCMTAAIYYEAATESDEGQQAVAQVVLNRARHPAFPGTVCGVVYQGTGSATAPCQFSFACDGAFLRAPSLAGWVRARRAAVRALAGFVYAPVGLATHYHTHAVHPSWDQTMTTTAVIGAHIFYRMNGGRSDPQAFVRSYAGHEPIPGPIPRPVIAPDPYLIAPQPTYAALAPLPVMPQPVVRPPNNTTLPDSDYISGAMPDSSVRAEYRTSGTVIAR
jgi:Cell Wall Hydrolase